MPDTAYHTMPTRTSYVRWGLVFWLFVLSAVAYLDRVNISTAAPLISKEFALTPEQGARTMIYLAASPEPPSAIETAELVEASV